jgi:hypothetical protein
MDAAWRLREAAADVLGVNIAITDAALAHLDKTDAHYSSPQKKSKDARPHNSRIQYTPCGQSIATANGGGLNLVMVSGTG